MNSLKTVIMNYSNNQNLKVEALKILGTFCCFTSGIEELVKTKALEEVVTILDSSKGDEVERREAAAVIAQATAPKLEKPQIKKSLENQSLKIIHGLKGDYSYYPIKSVPI